MPEIVCDCVAACMFLVTCKCIQLRVSPHFSCGNDDNLHSY